LEKEIKDKIKINSVDVFFIGEDLSIFHSLKNLSSKLETFFIEKTNFSKNITKNNNFFLIDDSLYNFDEKISFLNRKNFKNFFILLKKENLGVFEKKNYKVFLKPLKIFELHKEICNKISKNIEGGELWKLDRGKLKFYKDDKNYIDLTEKEFYFIYFLLQRRGDSLTKKQLLNKVWNISYNSNILNTRVVETLVSRIRKKFKKVENPPKIIKDSLGYKLLI
tara:strand:- start:1448 stop:2113 length:666 start_codon:yes stop_codon:yes gene_type:complete